jgi:hypothetical protein
MKLNLPPVSLFLILSLLVPVIYSNPIPGPTSEPPPLPGFPQPPTTEQPKKEVEKTDYNQNDILQILQVIGLTGVLTGTLLLANYIGKIRKSKSKAFERESIEFVVNNDGVVAVKGKYWIKNNEKTDCKFRLLYPFPKDSCLEKAQCASIKSIFKDSLYTPLYMDSTQYWLFDILMEADKSTMVEVNYRQKTNNGRFKYLLTSARAWGDTLSSATFIIKLPKTFTLKSSTYKYLPYSSDPDYNIYTISNHYFVPKEELMFSWQTD